MMQAYRFTLVLVSVTVLSASAQIATITQSSFELENATYSVQFEKTQLIIRDQHGDKVAFAKRGKTNRKAQCYNLVDLNGSKLGSIEENKDHLGLRVNQIERLKPSYLLKNERDIVIAILRSIPGEDGKLVIEDAESNEILSQISRMAPLDETIVRGTVQWELNTLTKNDLIEKLEWVLLSHITLSAWKRESYKNIHRFVRTSVIYGTLGLAAVLALRHLLRDAYRITSSLDSEQLRLKQDLEQTRLDIEEKKSKISLGEKALDEKKKLQIKALKAKASLLAEQSRKRP